MSHKHVLTSHYGQNVAYLVSVVHNETTRRAILQQSGLLGITESCIIKHHIYTMEGSTAMKQQRMFSEEIQAGTLEHTSMYF